MTYSDLMDAIDQIKADSVSFYGDYGFDLSVVWDRQTVAKIIVTWPNVGRTSLTEAYHFGEALQAICFDGNRLVGTVVKE